jgi:hypothetical protein
MKPILIALLFVAAVACTSQLYVPTEKNVNKVMPCTLADLQQGHDLFVNNCGKCHKLPNLRSHSDLEWKQVLAKEIPKAKLNNDDTKKIYWYIVNR